MSDKLTPALFLDRDGVVNQEVDYLYEIDKCRFIDGIFSVSSRFALAGFKIIIITNQAGIGRGLYSEEEYTSFMKWMSAQFIAKNVQLTAVYHCPHHPQYGIGKYKRVCECRKPNPGMILTAAKDHDLDLSHSILVGDKQSDIRAARSAGVGHSVFFPGKEQSCVEADYSIRKLDELCSLFNI